MTEFDSLKILGPFIIIEPISKNITRNSGIIIPESTWKYWYIGRVIKPGDIEYKAVTTIETKFDRGSRINRDHKIVRVYSRPDVKVGDIVLIEKQSMIFQYPLYGKNYYFVNYGDVALVLDSDNIITPS
jgi:co-chaperonin GroES (HSP10)